MDKRKLAAIQILIKKSGIKLIVCDMRYSKQLTSNFVFTQDKAETKFLSKLIEFLLGRLFNSGFWSRQKKIIK